MRFLSSNFTQGIYRRVRQLRWYCARAGGRGEYRKGAWTQDEDMHSG